MRRLVVMAVLLGGCELPAGGGAATRPTTATTTAVPTPPPEVRRVRADGASAGLATTHLDVFLLDVPAGTISGNVGFWRTVDEGAAGAAADERLLANGIRCGVAQRGEWRRFAQMFGADLDRARRTRVQSAAMQTVELEVEQPADREDLFFLNADRQLEGRSYDRATNGIAMTFGPTPRDPGSVRLSFCPIVKRQRRLLAFSPRNQPYDAAESDVDRLYDVGLTVDVPPAGFFILAPGPDADPDLTLGGRFLTRRGSAGRREQIIVAVPTLVPLSVTPTDD